LNLRGQNSDSKNLRFVPKYLHEDCSGLSVVIFVQFTVKNVPQSKIVKITKKSAF